MGGGVTVATVGGGSPWRAGDPHGPAPTFWARFCQRIRALLPWLQGRGGEGAPAGVQAKHVIGPCFGIGVQL